MNESPKDKELFTNIRNALAQVYDDFLHSEIETGFPALDRMIGGMRNDDLILIGGRPGMGKTAFALNIALSVAKEDTKKVCIFSWDLSSTQIASRMLILEAMIDSFSFRHRNLSNDDWEKLAHAATELAGCDILIDDTPNISVNEMRTKLRKIKNPGLVVVDYLGMLSDDSACHLKLLAQEFHVPVICCTNLPRRIENRKNKHPDLSDLRFIKIGAKVADIIMLLYRDDYYNFDNGTRNDTAVVNVARNRRGSTGTVKLGWNGRYAKFCDITYDP